MAAEPVLEVEHLTVTYGREGARLAAVDDLSFTVRRAETFGLVGESGSGKSSTAFAILGLIRPPGRIDGGSVRLEGTELVGLTKDEWRPIRWRRLSLVPQGAMNALNPVKTVGSQIVEPMRFHDTATGAEADKQAGELLELVGLPASAAKRFPHEFSGGMRQRAAIAMALACSPKVLLADEPTTALDVMVQAQIL